ncbi:TonB-dependent receptor [Terriglobus albidus]|uniref:TonB-dependent receptor n=1 Tax=Terriglobus albidus TaxID=1592106 RepID=UPI0021E0AC02|nr:TonB-dependent receptor [Terriglobus albidus]
MQLRNRIKLVFLALCCSLAGATALAQSSSGSIGGTVTDASGAVIPNASVTAINRDTNVATKSTTNQEGVYSIRFLQIGSYQVVVEAQGFNRYQVGPFTLETNQQLKVDGRLTVGDTLQVQVTTEVPLLNAENGTVNAVVDATTVDNIPVNGRNFTQLTQFMPGIALTNQNQWNGATGSPNNSGVRQQSVATAPSINGNRMITNNYTLDGIQFFDSGANFSNAFGLPGYNPSPDAIQQVTVVSTNPAAEFGFGTGGQILTVLKSGSNRFHGSVYDYLQNWNQDANTWSNKRVTPGTTPTARTKYTQQTFGASLGGRIVRDRLFFFGDYAGYRKPSSSIPIYSVAPAAFRTGDFSSLLGTSYGQLYDSQNNYAAFTNNKLPVNNPVAAYLFAHPELYPLPNRASTAPDGVYQNYTGTAIKALDRNDQGDLKVDYKIGEKDAVFARVSYGRARSGSNNQGMGVVFPLISEFPFASYAAAYTHTFSPAIVNEFRGGFTRMAYNSYNIDYTGVFGTKGDSLVGIATSFVQTIPGFTQQSFTGTQSASSPTTSLGTTGSGRLALNNNFEYDDTLSIQHGRHLFKAGLQWVWYQNNFQANPAGALGNFNYNGLYTGNPRIGKPNGYDYADFVLGYSSGSSISVGTLGRRGGRQWRSAYFFQDDWRITDKLTLNLGLRYEYDTPFHEVQNRMAKVDIATGQLRLAGQNGNNRALYNPFYGQFDPRFGFAWQLNNRTVLRGGFASTTFMDFNQFVSHLTNRPYVNTAAATATVPTTTSGGTVVNPASGFANASAVNTATNYTTWRDDLRPSFVPSFDLAMEYQISNTQTVMVAYVGNIGNRLLNLRNINQLKQTNTGTTTEVAPYFSLAGQTGTVTLFDHEGMQNYNAAEAIYRKRASRGVTFTLNYTYSKNLTNAQGYAAPSNISGGANYPQNAYDLRAEYGPAGFDIRNNLTSTWVVEMPFGRGQHFGRNMNRMLDLAVGGWKVAGNATLYSGFPITVQANNMAGTNQSTGRANHYRALKRTNARFLPPNTGAGFYGWWGNDPSATPCTTPGVDNGVCAYGVPALGTYGNAGIGSERSPGFRGIDAAGFKTFPIYETHELQFRVDAYNVGNISSYNNPGRSASSPASFGFIQSTRSQQRQIQFALKYRF